MADAQHSSVFTCGHCGSEFTGRKRKFCTAECREASRKPPRVHACANCGETFTGRKRKHCSEECRDAYSTKRRYQRGDRVPTGRNRRLPNPIINECRVCLDCERNLPISDFPECWHAKSGHRGLCKPCFAAFNYQRKQKAARTARNFKLEVIRTKTNRGECGPPTRDEYEALCRRLARQRKTHPTDSQIDRVAEQNARQAFQYLIKHKAPDAWCERYFSALGKPWLNRRLSVAERYRIRYRGDPLFAAKERVRRQVTKALKRDEISSLMRLAIKRKGKSRRVEKLIGYTIGDLCRHLEKQFTRGMTWDRFTAGDIHIDHITPQAAFDLADDSQWRACWCLSNLRPCWAADNLKKRDSRIFLI